MDINEAYLLKKGFKKTANNDTKYTLSRDDYVVTLIPDGQTYIPYISSNRLLNLFKKETVSELGIPCIQISDMATLNEFISAVPNIINNPNEVNQWIRQNLSSNKKCNF